MGKKRPGFADIRGTLAELERDELRCPTCNRKVTSADELKFIGTLGPAVSSLASLTCPRCRTMISIRFIAADEGHPAAR